MAGREVNKTRKYCNKKKLNTEGNASEKRKDLNEELKNKNRKIDEFNKKERNRRNKIKRAGQQGTKETEKKKS